MEFHDIDLISTFLYNNCGTPRKGGLSMKACFIGHRNILKSEELNNSLKETIITLINKGVTVFLFGSMSEFDNLTLKLVTELKIKYPFIKRVYVRSNYQFIDTSYESYLHKLYDETYFPIKLTNAGKYSYVERNYEMIDNSDFCVFYYNKNYKPLLREETKNTPLRKTRKSGTKIAYEYALKKQKYIINLYKTTN